MTSVICAATASAPCPVRQVQQQHEPGRPLHQRPDRRLIARPGDQVTLPVPGHRPVLHFGGPLADHHHPRDLPPPLPVLAARFPQRPPGAQARGEPPAQRTPSLHVDGLVDRLVGHLHLRVVRELAPQHHADLLRRPLLLQPGRNQAPQFLIPGQLRRLRPRRPVLRLPLRRQRPVLPPAPAVPPDLPADRRPRPPQPPRDLPQRLLTRQPDRDLLPLTHRQEPSAPRPRPVRLNPARLLKPRERLHRADPRSRPCLLHTQPRPHTFPELHLHSPRHRRTAILHRRNLHNQALRRPLETAYRK